MSWLRRLPAGHGHVLSVQEDGATLGVAERPHRVGGGAGQGGRGRALQGRKRVRFLGLDPHVVGLPQCEGGRSGDSGMGLQEWLVRLCRRMALHSASQNGHTETAMALVKAGADVHCTANDGYGSRGRMLVSLGCRQCGGGRSVDSGVELQ
jgi:hypothetical protein